MAHTVTHDEHAAGAAHPPHRQSFFHKYLWSTDHKIIALQYTFTGMAMAMIGATVPVKLPHTRRRSTSLPSASASSST